MKFNKLILSACILAFLPVAMFSQDMLSLTDAIERTLANNYGILISEIQIEQAVTGNTLGNAGGLPSIGFDASSQNSLRFSEGESTRINNISASLGLSWRIFDGFRVRINIDRLQELENLSRGQSAVVVENSIQDLVMGYYYILLLEENLKVRERLMKLSEDRYKYEKARYELGGTVSVNVLLAKNLWLNDKAAFLKQEIAVKDAKRSLNYIMGEKDNPAWELSESFSFEQKEYQLSVLLNKMISNNQVLRNQYINQSLKEKDRRLKESDMMPELSVSGGVSNSYNITNGDGKNTFYPYGNISFSYDIFTGGVRKTAIKVAEMNEEISKIQSEDIIHSLSNHLLQVYDNFLLKNDILEIAEESLEVAEMNLEIAGEKYKNGSITSFEYRDIQIIYLNAAQDRLSAIFDLIDSDTELTRLTGGFISPE